MNIRRFVHILRYDYVRPLKHFVQRRIRGFDDSELWSLDHSLAKLILPRLKRFRKGSHGYPGCFNSWEEWCDVLDEMIVAIEYVASENYWNMNVEMDEKVSKGLKLFAEHYESLWW